MLLLALVAVAVMQSSVWAGGNNGKSKLVIKVRNDTDFLAAVIIDPADDLDVEDEDAFREAGGKILEPDAQGEWKVKKGRHVIAAALLDVEGDLIGDIATIVVNAKREAKVSVEEGAGGAFLRIRLQRN